MCSNSIEDSKLVLSGTLVRGAEQAPRPGNRADSGRAQDTRAITAQALFRHAHPRLRLERPLLTFGD
jgi:hypothetical protein